MHNLIIYYMHKNRAVDVNLFYRNSYDNKNTLM